MGDFGDRVREVRETTGLSQAKFAEKINGKQGQISSTESGNSLPRIDFLFRLKEEFPRLSIDWLLFGEGRMWEGEGENIPAPATSATGSSFPGLPEEDLRRLSALAQRGGTLGAWRVWCELAERHPEAMSAEEISRELKERREAIKPALDLLLAYGLIIQHHEQYRSLRGRMRTAGPTDSAELILEAIRILSRDVAPHLVKADQKAKLVVATLPVKSAAQAQQNVFTHIKEVWDAQSAEDGEETVVLILASADATLTTGAEDAEGSD